MKTELSLSEMAVELERRSKAKKDFIVPTKKLHLNEKGILIIEAADDGQNVGYDVNDVAHSQIADRLDIPAKYYNRMRDQAPALLADNVNLWLQKAPEQRMVRTLDGKARAFLSDSYARIENEEIASSVLPVLLEQQSVKIASCAISEQRMYIKAVFTHIQAEVRKGDIVQSGVCISNSEVGRGAVKIEPFIERLICTNGMVMKDSSFSARHIGARAEKSDSAYEMYTDETKMADDRAILLKIRDIVRGSFDEIRFKKHVELMQVAMGEKISGKVEETVKVLGKKSSLTEFEQDSILRHLIEGADLSRYGLAQAVTRTAQDVGTYDRSHELEVLGGDIITLPRTDWKVLAVAA